jgi:hypothetical protein
MNTCPATPPVTPSRPPSHAANQNANTHARTPTPAPRHQVERQSLYDRFAAKLERDDSAKSTHRDEAGQRRGLADAALTALFAGERDASDDGAQPDLGQRDVILRLTAAAIIAEVTAPAPAAFDTALFSQIAAQIAEGVPVAGASEASIEFPAGSLAESAHLRREADGSIAIRIAGLDPRLSVMQNGRAQMELRAAIALRRLQVSSLTLECGRADDPGQDPPLSRPISRVV